MLSKSTINSKHNIQFLISFNSHIFRHRSAIYMQSTKTNGHQTNSPIPVLIAFTVSIKILKFKEHNIFKYNPQNCHTKTICLCAASSTVSQLFVFCLQQVYKYLPRCM